MSDYRVHQPGDILRLDDDLPQADAGLYVLLSCGDVFALAVLSEDEDGLLCATSTQIRVPAADFCRFVVVGLAINPLAW